MTDPFHGLLQRQLTRHFGEVVPAEDPWRAFLAAVDKTYRTSDTDRAMLERSLEQSSQDLSQANSEMRAIFEAFPDLFFRLAADGTILECKVGRVADFYLGSDELRDKRIQDLPPDHVGDVFRDAIDRVRDTQGMVSVEYSVTLDQQDRFYEARFLPLFADQIFVIVRNVTDRKRAEDALAEQAIRDPLTNLYNRRYFNHRLEEEIARAERHQRSFAVLLCDLDHFKAINDTRGHQVGDEVLKAAATCIQDATRGTDLVFRWGGDEIVVVLANDTRDGIVIATNRIRNGMRKIQAAMHVELDLSIGVAIYPEHGRRLDDLMRLADRALYLAKKGGEKVHFGEPAYEVDADSLQIVFQPIVDVRSERIIGYEALGRDPQGKLGIQEVFRRYEAVGHLNELKRICFRSQLEAARAAGFDRVFLNVDFDVLSQLEGIAKPPNLQVVLEISELEALDDVERHLSTTRIWREKGFQLAIDDFGAGFISLPFIAQAMPDYIKVDRSTILQAVGSETFRKFLKDLVRALHNYATQGIVAEGIETDEELEVSRTLGIDFAQGYRFGRPEPLAALRRPV